MIAELLVIFLRRHVDTQMDATATMSTFTQHSAVSYTSSNVNCCYRVTAAAAADRDKQQRLDVDDLSRLASHNIVVDKRTGQRQCC